MVALLTIITIRGNDIAEEFYHRGHWSYWLRRDRYEDAATTGVVVGGIARLVFAGEVATVSFKQDDKKRGRGGGGLR